MNTGVDQERDHLHRRRQGHPALPRLPDRGARREVDASSRRRYLLIYGHAADASRSSTRFSHAAHPPLADPRGHEAVLRRLPADRPPDGGPVGDGAARCRRYYPEALDINDKEQLDITIARLLSKVRTIAAFSYKKSIGQPFVYPQNYAHVLRELPAHDVRGAGRAVRGRRRRSRRALNLLLILHADHEQNCSTSTVRMVGSSQREPVRLDLGRHLRALGPAPRRRQPGSHRDARARSRPTAAT